MYNKEKIVGHDFGIWHIDFECKEKSKKGVTKYHATCRVCGYETEKIFSVLKNVNVCQHLNKRNAYKSNIQYKWGNKKLQRKFASIISRCYNENNKCYKFYGGKGIKICDSWIDNPTSFEKWAMESGYKDGLTIDRIDSDGDYCPENCRWVSKSFNSRFKGNTNVIDVNGEKYSARELSEKLFIGSNRISEMIKRDGIEKTIKFAKARLYDIENNKSVKMNATNWMEYYNIT